MDQQLVTPPASATAAKASVGPSGLWMVVMVLTAALVFGGQVGFGPRYDAAPAIVASLSIVAFALIAAVVVLGFMRRERRVHQVWALVIIAISMVAGGFLRQRILDRAELSHDLAVARAERALEQGAQVVAASSGDQKAVTDFLTSVTGIEQQQFDAFVAAVNETGYHAVLDPLRLSRDTDLVASKEMIAKVRALITPAREKRGDLLTAIAKSLGEISVSPATRSAALAGFERDRPARMQELSEIWDQEVAMVNEVDELIEQLATKRSAWSLGDEGLAFTDEGLRYLHEAHIAHLVKLGETQHQVRQRFLAGIATSIRGSAAAP